MVGQKFLDENSSPRRNEEHEGKEENTNVSLSFLSFCGFLFFVLFVSSWFHFLKA